MKAFRPFCRVLACALGLLAPALVEAAPAKVVATNAVLADWVRQVGGDAVEVVLVGGGHAHHAELSPGDLRRLRDSDLVVAVGLGLEPWLDRAVPAGGKPRRLVLGTGVPLIPFGSTITLTASSGPLPSCCAPSAEGTKPAEGDVGAPRFEAVVNPPSGRAAPDPHVWLDLRLAAGFATALGDELASILPDRAEALVAAGEAYARRLGELETWVTTALAAIPGERRVLVAAHPAFAYFARRHGLAMPVAPLPGHHGAEPSARAVANFTVFARTTGLPALFGEVGHGERQVRALAAAAGIPVAFLHAETLPAGDPTYEGMIRHDVAVLLDTLAPGTQAAPSP